MAYPIQDPHGHQVVGNLNTNEFHLTARETANCQIPEIVQARNLVGFNPDTSWQAEREGFNPCWYCAR